jgi:hypothetical protein
MFEIDNKNKEMQGLNNGNDEPVRAVVLHVKNMFQPRTDLLDPEGLVTSDWQSITLKQCIATLHVRPGTKTSKKNFSIRRNFVSRWWCCCTLDETVKESSNQHCSISKRLHILW